MLSFAAIVVSLLSSKCPLVVIMHIYCTTKVKHIYSITKIEAKPQDLAQVLFH